MQFASPLAADVPPFLWDVPGSLRSRLLIRADLLGDYGLDDLATLIRLQVDGHKENPDVLTNIRMLQELIQIRRVKNLNKQIGREFHTAILENPIGDLYTKITVSPWALDNFDEEIKDMPILELVLTCAGRPWNIRSIMDGIKSSHHEVKKYQKYRWLKKVETLELNNLNVNFPEVIQIFKDSELKPIVIKFTGRQIPGRLELSQVKMMKMICQNQYLKEFVWGTQTFKL